MRERLCTLSATAAEPFSSTPPPVHDALSVKLAPLHDLPNVFTHRNWFQPGLCANMAKISPNANTDGTVRILLPYETSNKSEEKDESDHDK